MASDNVQTVGAITIRARLSDAHIKDMAGLAAACHVNVVGEDEFAGEIVERHIEITTNVASPNQVEAAARALGKTIERFAWGEWRYTGYHYPPKSGTCRILWDD